MKKVLMLLIILVLSNVPSLFAQDGKEDVALQPLATLGEIKEREQQIIFNQLQSLLSQHYKLVPQSLFEKAMDRMEQELDLETCDEESCIRKVQDLLQVGKMFNLMMVRDGDITQLSLTLIREEDRVVKAGNCDKCDVMTLIDNIEELVNQIVKDDLGAGGGVVIAASNQTGQVMITTIPTGAFIILDGKEREETSDALLKDIPIGEHTLKVFRDGMGTSTTFTLSPDETKRVELTLDNVVKIQVNSIPFNARVYVDGKSMGNAPLTFETSSGGHQLKLTHPDKKDFYKYINVDLLEKNRFDIALDDSPTITLITKPLDAVVEIDGVEISSTLVTGTEEGFMSTVNKKRTFMFSLPPGNKQVKISHPRAKSNVEKTITIADGDMAESLSLDLTDTYLEEQEYFADMDSRPTKILWSSIGGGAFAIIAVLAYNNAKDAKAKQEGYEADMGNAASREEAESYQDDIDAQNTELQSYNSQTQTATLLSAALFSYATWKWLFPPDKPETLTWQPQPVVQPDGTVSFAWQMKW
jgi:PEGA domain